MSSPSGRNLVAAARQPNAVWTNGRDRAAARAVSDRRQMTPCRPRERSHRPRRVRSARPLRIAELLSAATAQQQAQAGPSFRYRRVGSRRWSATKTPERAVGGTGARPQDRGAVVDQDMLVDGGGGLPGPDRCPGQASGQLGTLGPEHLGGQLLGLGEGLGLVGGLGLICL